MLTVKENYLKAARCEKPEWVPAFGDANILPPFIWDFDPETKTDWLNITWVQENPLMAAMPVTSKPAMTDICDWRDIIKWPDLSKIDWEQKVKEFHENPDFPFDPNKATICMANTNGIFLTPINMMGWVDGMVAMMEEPEEYKALVDALTDFLVEYIGYLGKYFHPDIIFSGDDVAAGTGPFVSEETYDEIFQPNFKRIADAIHEVGALAEFHCCGDCRWVIDKEVEAGFDICQLPMPNDDLVARMAKYKGRLAMTGGWDRKGPGFEPGASEEVVRQSVRDAIDTYGKDGGLIFWDGGIILDSDENKQKMDWVMDEVRTYGAKVYCS